MIRNSNIASLGIVIHTNLDTKPLQAHDEDIRGAHALHSFVAKNIPEISQIRAPHKVDQRQNLQLPTVKRLVDLPMLDHLHSRLEIVYLHRDVLQLNISRNATHPASTKHTVIVFLCGRPTESFSRAVRFPSLAASRKASSEGMVVMKG